MRNKKMVETIEICSEYGNLFDVECPYKIPLYQRPYAWGEDQIRDLIEDISDVPENNESFKYCLGSLIVSKNSETYEVIDGQQRLTTLFLLLNFLKINTKKNLSFACREKSTKTLREINKILDDDQNLYDTDTYQEEILKGLRIIKRFLPEKKDCLVFKKKLKNVFLYRIIVPEHTNLNHYFEIMNTRGEQLEQTDVLKGRLMAFLSDDEKRRSIFAKIWDACSDMTGYVQMHFTPDEREKLFGSTLNDSPSRSYERGGYLSLNPQGTSSSRSSVKDIIREDFKIDDVDGNLENGQNVKFESIIEFKHFLLHVLKVYIRVYLNCDDNILPKAIDEKGLIKYFEEVEKKCLLNGEKISLNRDKFAFSFGVCLLRCRFLFDKYIIKREFEDEDPVGEWSLKELKAYGKKKNNNYVNTLIKDYYERDENQFEFRNKRCLMLQAALRVSYTSPKSMHWITELLTWLVRQDSDNGLAQISEIETYIESFIQSAVKENFLNYSENERFCLGLKTQHIIFNYLDYLLWKDAPMKYKDFVFEFRNSIEHWYPQNPSNGTFDRWEHEDGLDQFGNLCLVPSNINASFSNLDPQVKKIHFKDEVAKGSLKLRKMAEATVNEDNPDHASERWKEMNCAIHGAEMIKKLKKACNFLI